MKSDFMTNLFFRALQTVSIATMIVRLLLPVAIVAALYLLWRIARNLEKPPKLTEEVKIVRKSLSEMLKENLYAEQNKNDTAGKFSLVLIAGTEDIADFDAAY